MPIGFKRSYRNEVYWRYRNAKKKEKSAILDEFCRVCGYTRKHAIELLNEKPLQQRIIRPGASRLYDEASADLKALWELMGGICSKRMAAAMPLWLEFYSASERVKELLLRMSPASIDRYLVSAREEKFGKGLSSTRPSLRMKMKIPIKLLEGEIHVPGFVEGDTVVHCGSSLLGEYASTVTVVDLFSGWTQLRATWTKEAEGVKNQVAKIENRLPFTLIGFASDNGSEFINEVLYQYFSKRQAPVKFVRRRAYKKNDNAHVEQRNWTQVRQLFGYGRFDDPNLVGLMNEIYDAYWCPLQNYFTPVMKIIAKERVGGRVKKTYDKPQTPAQRLLDCPLVPNVDKARIREERSVRNPVDLKNRLDQKIKEFFRIVDQLEKERRKVG